MTRLTVDTGGPVNPTVGDNTVEDWLQLIRGEYLEIPGLQLTKPQIRRLWGLDASTCEAVVAALVETGFLAASHDDLYRRFQGEH